MIDFERACSLGCYPERRVLFSSLWGHPAGGDGSSPAAPPHSSWADCPQQHTAAAPLRCVDAPSQRRRRKDSNSLFMSRLSKPNVITIKTKEIQVLKKNYSKIYDWKKIFLSLCICCLFLVGVCLISCSRNLTKQNDLWQKCTYWNSILTLLIVKWLIQVHSIWTTLSKSPNAHMLLEGHMGALRGAGGGMLKP